MPLKNLLQNQLSLTDLDNISKAIDSIQTAVDGKMMQLTPEERQKYGNINEQNKRMVSKVSDIHQSHPQFDSPKVNWNEFSADLVIRGMLQNILTRLQSLVEQFGDTKILYDNDNYQQALAQYSYISFLADQNEPGINPVKEQIARFFSRTGKKIANST